MCESPHGLAARAVINADGSFQLGTYEEADGAVEGKHKVAIWPMPPADSHPDAGGPRAVAIDNRFLSMDTSGIEFDITSDGENHFPIEVTAKAAR